MVKTDYKNRLPHLTPIGATFFITFRLADALPRFMIRRLQEEWKDVLVHYKKKYPNGNKGELIKLRKMHFGSYEHQLDKKPYGACVLKRKAIAELIMAKLHQYDSLYYHLIAYCIMPNHVHFLADFSKQLEGQDLLLNDEELNYTQLHKVMQYIKGGSARAINLELGRTGNRLWAKDSYDHYIRNGKEFGNVISYILNNPLQAGLVEKWDDWAFLYLIE